METYDIIMLVVLAATTLFGAIKGFAWQVASIASLVVSYMVAYHFREPFSQSIQAEPPWNRFLAMLILFVGTSLAIWVLFRMIAGTIDRLRLNEFDRQIGAIFGFGKGLLYCAVITFFAVTLLGDATRDRIVASKSGNYIAQVLGRSESVIPPEIQQIVQPHLEKFDQRFNSDQPVDSLFPAFAGGGAAAAEGRGGSVQSLSGSVADALWPDSSMSRPARQLEPYPSRPSVAPVPGPSFEPPGRSVSPRPALQQPPSQGAERSFGMQQRPTFRGSPPTRLPSGTESTRRSPQLGESTPWQPPGEFQR